MKSQLIHSMIRYLGKILDIKKVHFFYLKYLTNQAYFNGHFYSIVNHHECYLRAINFEIKEKDTLQWINEFNEEDVFFDIGANIGVYSLYAAPKVKSVFAFEPHYQNYSNINMNKSLNKFKNLKIYCLAFDKTPGFGSFYHYKTNPGSSTSQLNRRFDHNNKRFEVLYEQEIIVESLYSFIKKSNSFPNHIKIDVDGIEFQILEGLGIYLKDDRLKSILIEITGDSTKYEKLLKSNGFTLLGKTLTSQKEITHNFIFKRTNKINKIEK